MNMLSLLCDLQLEQQRHDDVAGKHSIQRNCHIVR